MTDGAAVARELVTPERLRTFFAPRSIALVGASDNSGWARFIVASCATAGFAGPLTAVHPRAKGAFGLPVVRSLRDLAETAELAFILTPVQAVEGVLDEMGAVGTLVAGPAPANDHEAGRRGAAERRTGQRGAVLRQGARDRAEPADLDGQRGHDDDGGRPGLPVLGRCDQGNLPVPRGDRRPG